MRFVTVRHTVTTLSHFYSTISDPRAARGTGLSSSSARVVAAAPPPLSRPSSSPSVPIGVLVVSPHRYRRPYPYSALARPSAESITMKPSRLVASLIVGSISRTISFAPSPIHSAGTVSRLSRATQPIREIRHGRKRHPHLPHTHCSHAHGIASLLI